MEIKEGKTLTLPGNDCVASHRIGAGCAGNRVAMGDGPQYHTVSVCHVKLTNITNYVM